MHPARAKAKQTIALVETAESVAALREQMGRIEAKQDAILARLDAIDAPKTAPGRKDR